MSTPLDIDAIRARAAAASEGPWGTADTWGQGIAVHRGTHDTIGLYLGRPDAEFIANARADVPALLDEVERLRGLLVDAGVRYTGPSADAEFQAEKKVGFQEFVHAQRVEAERDRAEATIARVRELATSKSVVGEVRGGGFQYVVVASDLLAAIERTDS